MDGELLLALGLALAVGWWLTHRGPHVRPGARVALIGDSLAQGLKDPLGRLAAQDGVQLFADVQPGTRIDQWMTRGPAFVEQAGATCVLVSLGTNDSAGSGALRDKNRALVTPLIAALRAKGAKVVWLMPPPMPFDTHWLLAPTQDGGAIVLLAMDYPRYDGIHPTPEGFKTWASHLWHDLRK